MSFVDAFFDYEVGRARLASGRFISNRAARGIGLLDGADDDALGRLMAAADTIADSYGGTDEDARVRIAEWYARREEGTPDEENPFPSP